MKTTLLTALFLLVALSIPQGTAEACGGYVVPANTLAREGPIVTLTGAVTSAHPVDYYAVTLGPAEDIALTLRAAQGAQVHVAYQTSGALGVPLVATCGGWTGADSSTSLTGSAPLLAFANPSGTPTTYILSVEYLSGTTDPMVATAPYLVDGAVAIGV